MSLLSSKNTGFKMIQALIKKATLRLLTQVSVPIISGVELSSSAFVSSFLVSAKSLSWKGRRREAGSSDKNKESRNRRQRGFVSAYFSSPRHHRKGRSCRQIKRSE